MIELIDVSKTFVDPQGRPVHAVDGLNLDVAAGESIALIGPSGCGKTTTMKLINRLIVPTTGEVRFDGTNVTEWDEIRLRRRIGYVIQNGGLLPHLTVEQNIGLLGRLESWDPHKTRERAQELLQLVNLAPSNYARRYPKELSGGQRQRVGVARALMLDPPCILMDEPFGALDPITRDQLHDEFLMLKKRVNKTIVIVTHDMTEAFKLADRVALMNEGKIEQIGSERDFRTHPAGAFVETFLKSHLQTHVVAHA